MRSVFLIFEESKKKKIIEFLNNYCDNSDSSEKQWIVSVHDDACLYIYFNSCDDFMPFPKDFDNKVVLLQIDISGRHDGTKKVTELIHKLFSVEPGYACDDYSEHFWTDKEIQDGILVEGHVFFDFKGWYKESN